MSTGKFDARGNPVIDWHPSRGKEILPVTLCYRKWDKLQPDGPLGLSVDYNLTLHVH